MCGEIFVNRFSWLRDACVTRLRHTPVKSLLFGSFHMTAAVLERTKPQTTGQSLIQVKGLGTEFATHSGPLRAVNDVSLMLQPGKTLAILGESGSGKSVLLRTILGIQPKNARTQGEVIMNGVDLMKMS